MQSDKKRWQDEFTTIYKTDNEWLRVSKDGKEETLEVAHEYFRDKEKRFFVYKFSPDRLKVITDEDDASRQYLVPYRYGHMWPYATPQYHQWFADKLEAVAESCGYSGPEALTAMLCSADVSDRASAYRAIGDYFGFDNLDSYPLCLSEGELDERWK